jgi:hypothetical protein
MALSGDSNRERAFTLYLKHIYSSGGVGRGTPATSNSSVMVASPLSPPSAENLQAFEEDLTKLSSEGDCNLLIALGRTYSDAIRSWRGSDHYERAAKCFIRALNLADGNNREQMEIIFERLAELESRLQEEAEKAQLFRLYESEAERDPRMRFHLGRLHLIGFGTPVNFTQAMECHEHSRLSTVLADAYQVYKDTYLTAYYDSLAREPGVLNRLAGGFAGVITGSLAGMYVTSRSGLTLSSPIEVARQWGAKVPVAGHIAGFVGSLLLDATLAVLGGVVGFFCGAGFGATWGYQKGSGFSDFFYSARIIAGHESPPEKVYPGTYYRRPRLVEPGTSPAAAAAAASTASACKGLNITPRSSIAAAPSTGAPPAVGQSAAPSVAPSATMVQPGPPGASLKSFSM